MVTGSIPGLGLRREVLRMSRRDARKEAVQGKLAELRRLSKKRAAVVERMGNSKKSYGELTRRMDEVKTEIRFLGGEIPVGREYNERLMLWELIEPRKLSDERA